MVSLSPKTDCVDLFTRSCSLYELMLQDYPERLKPERYQIDDSDPDVRVYCFYDLRRETLENFLKPYRQQFAYELRRSFTGKIIFEHCPLHGTQES